MDIFWKTKEERELIQLRGLQRTPELRGHLNCMLEDKWHLTKCRMWEKVIRDSRNLYKGPEEYERRSFSSIYK